MDIMTRNSSSNKRHRLFAPYFEFYLKNWFEKVETTGLEMLKEIPADSHVVYVASHKSHIDWVSAGLVFYKNGINVPKFIATKSLEESLLFGSLLKKMNAKFIDPLNSDPGYLARLRSELEKDMINGEDILFFPERGRSYTGNMLKMSPYFLILPIQVQRKTSQDVRIVPLAISYDKVLEDFSLINLAQKRKKESGKDRLWSMLFSRFITGNKGSNIYVDIGKPISVDIHEPTRELADRAFSQIKELYRVTPTSLVAFTFRNSELASLDGIKSNISLLRKTKLNMRTLERMSYEEIYEKGLNMLETRGAIKQSGGIARIKDHNLLSYYANMIQV